MLVHLYSAYASPSSKGKWPLKLGDEERPLGPSLPNGHVRRPSASDRQAQDAQEFELEGLMSDDDGDGGTGKANGKPRGD